MTNYDNVHPVVYQTGRQKAQYTYTSYYAGIKLLVIN